MQENLRKPQESYYTSPIDHNPHQIRSVNLGWKYGLVAAYIMLVYFLALLISGANSMLLHGLGKILIIGSLMFYAFSIFEANRKRPKLHSSLKLGFTTALTAAAALLLVEYLLHTLIGIKLAPQMFLDFSLPPIALYLLMALEMIVYGVIACLACTLYFKRERTKKSQKAGKSALSPEVS